ncbi:rhomboid family intramembrane serine protease [Ahrensia marina]|uniref:Peptidase S54 rhomboid domain-containing protein n=1 Tax=Ahrensia marina TaxID=1514904 RepID=A0A0N0E7X5_9HYPH|nr:rhomboid family intramembrane serine protease [Ahrensia marina]KPB01602.1 hypothetical protein SU32_06895 [Ahrensia marina]
MENLSVDDEFAQKQPREPMFNLPGILVVFVIICVGMHILRNSVFSRQLAEWVFVTFAYFPIRFTPEYFTIDLPTMVSPIGHTFLHGDWAHLGMNMIWLVAFGAPVAYRLGALRSIVFWVLTALGAVLLHTLIYYGDTVPLVGASGAVSGFLGGAARFGFRSNRRNPRAGLAGPLYGPVDSLRQRGVIPFLTIWMVLNFAFGSDLLGLNGGASIAWEAHIGGLVTGFFAIGYLDRKRFN